jgi:hypothetical protein
LQESKEAMSGSGTEPSMEATPAVEMPMTAAGSGAVASAPIVAGPGQYYRNTRYIMAALTVVMGFWFGYDGFIRWPAENVTIARIESELSSPDETTQARLKVELKGHSKHTDTDLLLQRLLAFALPPLGICLLLWALYNSRGEYRLVGETLFIPGHPPVPLPAIRELDQSIWDRKGIARVAYTLSDDRSGTAKIDDFVYDRIPTDQIYDQIKSHLQPPAPPPASLVEGSPASATETPPA